MSLTTPIRRRRVDEHVTERPQISLLSPARGTTNAGDFFIEAAVRRLLGSEVSYEVFSTRRELSRADISAINRSRALVICGTNLYQAHWTAPAISRRSLRRIKVPIVPIGVGSSSREASELQVPADVADIIRAIHERCALGSARDPLTLEFLEGLGIENARLTGCPVLHWHGREEFPVPDARERKQLVISPRNWLMHHDDPVDHPSTLAIMGALLELAAPEDIAFVAHEEVDLRLAARLNLRESQVIWPRSTSEYVSRYSNQDAVVAGFRLHGGMLALANAVPAVFIGHDTRTYSFCEMVGLPTVRQLDPRAPAETASAISEVLEGRLDGVTLDRNRYRALRMQMDLVLAANDLGERGTDAC